MYICIYIQYLLVCTHTVFKSIGITSHCAFSTVYRGKRAIELKRAIDEAESRKGDIGIYAVEGTEAVKGTEGHRGDIGHGGDIGCKGDRGS
jgi:hypothetical protein